MSLLLEGKRAFISGGTRGIGAAICEVFAREGADIAFNYHTSDELAAQVLEYVDLIAERATALGGLAQGTVRLSAANSQLPVP